MADSRGFVFGPGTAFLTLGTYTDGTSPAVSYPRKIDVLQEISVDFDLSIKRLFGQNIYPEAIGIGEGKVTGKVKNARFYAGLINDGVFGLSGVGGGGITSGRQFIADPPESHTTMGAAPTNGTLTSTSAGALGATTYYVECTWVNAYGDETPASSETNLACLANLVLNVAAPATPPAWAVGWNVYVSNTAGGGSGAETRQNGSTPIGLTTAWVEPTSGLVAGVALPSGTNANQFKVANAALTPLADLGLAYGSSGLFLTPVASSPAQGQYVFNKTTGVVTLNASDQGVIVLQAYSYTVTSGYTETIIQQVQGQVGIYALQYQGRYASRRIGLRLPNVVSSKFNLPTKQQDFVLGEINFEAFADPSGNVGYLYLAE